MSGWVSVIINQAAGKVKADGGGSRWNMDNGQTYKDSLCDTDYQDACQLS